jgi:hypothetical protein
VRRRIELNYRGQLPVGGNGHPSEAKTTACVWCRYARGMKPVEVVAQVAYVLFRQNKAKVARAVSSPHGDERNPCLKLRQDPLSERIARYRESGVDSP